MPRGELVWRRREGARAALWFLGFCLGKIVAVGIGGDCLGCYLVLSLRGD